MTAGRIAQELHDSERTVRRHLEKALLVWIVSGSQGRPHLVAFYKVDHPRQWFEERVLEIRKAFNRDQPDEFDPQISEQLFNGLFPAPFAQYVTTAKSIIFVPDDILFLLPLERLGSRGYVALKRDPHGFVITVANSCKLNIWRSDKNGHPDRTKMPARSDKSADQTDRIVRSNKEDSAVDSAQRQNLPLNPPSGDLTPRQLHNLSKEINGIFAARVGSNVSEEEALRTACVRLCLPLEEAREALARSYGEKTG